MYTPLFDRFESDRQSGARELARDIADIIGARRISGGNLPGILGWGLPATTGLSPTSSRDRERIAGYIAEALRRFEPRLERVSVAPLEDTSDFAFRIDAQFHPPDDDSIMLRILSPRRGGGLGADVAVIGGSDGIRVYETGSGPTGGYGP